MSKKFESGVYLEPIEHVYIHKKTGKKFKSVTTIISAVEEKFAAEDISASIESQSNAKKDEKYIGMSQADILSEWERINDEANSYGSMVHQIVEDYLMNNKWYKPKDDFEKDVISAYDELNIDEGMHIWPERILFSEEFELAGMCDLLIDVDDDFFDIGDWKGLAIDTPIFTDSGWKTMGTITTSDKVYDMDGKLVSVLHTSNIKNKKCYKINFDNNESVIPDFEHRWLISFYRDKKYKDVVMTTEELFDYINNLGNKRWSHKIPKIRIAKPLNNNHVDLPIDPYVFGLWLGDGHSADAKITNMNDEIWNEIKSRGYEIGEDISQGASGKASTRTVFGLQSKLRELGLLNNKHLPEIFLHSSYEQRLLILRGFMDSDGHYNKKRKRFVMSTTKKWQSDAFNELVSSLGIKTTVINYNKKANGKIVNVFDVLFSVEHLNPFLIRNQGESVITKQNNRDFKNITTIESVESVPTRCIEVNSDSHTFLYGKSFSITHNTNKAFNYFSPYKKTLLPPFDYLQDCQYSVYTLQLSVYALMYEMETGKKCRQLWVAHFNKATHKFTKIPIMYLKHEALKLMNMHKYKSKLNNYDIKEKFEI